MPLLTWDAAKVLLPGSCCGYERKAVRPTHREAKQNETSEFGAGECLLQGHARVAHAQKTRAPCRVSLKRFQTPGEGGGVTG